MDWQAVFEIIAAPAFFALCGAIWRVRSELREEIKGARLEAESAIKDARAEADKSVAAVAAVQNAFREMFHQEIKSIIRDYVPKQEVVRLENRILEEFRSLHDKVDRIATARSE